MVSGETRVTLKTFGSLLGVARCAVVSLLSLPPGQAVVAGRSFVAFWSLSAIRARKSWFTFWSRQVYQGVRNVYGQSGVTHFSGRSGGSHVSGLSWLAVVSLLAEVGVSGFSLATSKTRKAFLAVRAAVTRVSEVARVSLGSPYSRQAHGSRVALATRQAPRSVVSGFALLAFDGARR